MRTAVSMKSSCATSTTSGLTNRMVFGRLTSYPKDCPVPLMVSHQLRSCRRRPPPPESSAYQICRTSGWSVCKVEISGTVDRALNAMLSGSPWVVPSSEVISPPPSMMSREGCWYALCRKVARTGQVFTLWSAALLFMELNALVASTRSMPSVDLA